ncbi:UNVERIFIED_CONTAM: phaF [Trichonephila clavipes]
MLSGSVELSTLFLATLLAIIIPRLVRPFIARTPHIHWIPAIKLFFVVFWDIVISNFRVARMVLGPIDHLQPKWYRVPLETEHEEVNTLLAMIITTTPGTVSAGIDQERANARSRTMTILPYALGICLVAITISMFLCLIRLIIGPSVIDRLLALDTLFLNATCLIIVLGVYWVSTNVFEGALLVAMLGFVSTAALARYFTTGHVID